MAPKRLTALQLWGKRLAQTREAAGVSQTALANTVYVSPSLIGMWESGKRPPKLKDIQRCDEVLQTGGHPSWLLEEWVSREVSPQWLDKWRTIEERATTLLSFEPTVVPGLLQTEEYARAVLKAGRYYDTDVEEMVKARLERQKLLDCQNPPFLVVLLDESALHRNPGNDQIMVNQLMHLANMAEREKVVVYVVPLTSPASVGFLSTFMIATFDKGEVAYVDNQLRGEVVEQQEEVATLRELFERFRADALSRQASIDLIRRVADQWSAK